MDNKLHKLNILEGFKNLKPESYEGQQFIKMYENIDQSNYMQVATMLINGAALRESKISNWCKQKQIKISKTIPVNMQIGYAIDEAKQTMFGQTLENELGYLRYYSENDLKDTIGNGILESYIDLSPRLKALHESICKANVTKTANSSTHQVFTPVSFIHESKGKQYFMVEGKCFCYSLDKITESEIPTHEFAKVNMAVQEVPFDMNGKIFSLGMLPGAVNITKKGKVTINGEEVDGIKFNQVMTSAISECMDPQVRAWNARMADNINLIMENFDGLCELDNVDTCKNIHTNESISLMRHPNGYLLFENSSTGAKVSFKMSINESINYIKKHTGINLFTKYSKEALRESNDVNKLKQLLNEQIDVKKEIEKSLSLLEDELAILNVNAPERNNVLTDKEVLQEELKIAESNIESYTSLLNSLE